MVVHFVVNTNVTGVSLSISQSENIAMRHCINSFPVGCKVAVMDYCESRNKVTVP